MCYFVCYFRLTKQGCRKRFFLGNRGIMKQEDTPKRSFESAASTNSATLAFFRNYSEKQQKKITVPVRYASLISTAVSATKCNQFRTSG